MQGPFGIVAVPHLGLPEPQSAALPMAVQVASGQFVASFVLSWRGISTAAQPSARECGGNARFSPPKRTPVDIAPITTPTHAQPNFSMFIGAYLLGLSPTEHVEPLFSQKNCNTFRELNYPVGSQSGPSCKICNRSRHLRRRADKLRIFACTRIHNV